MQQGENEIKIYNDNSYQFSNLVNSTAPEIDLVTVSKLSLSSEPNNGYNLTIQDSLKVNFFIDMPYYGAEGGHIEYSYLETTDDKSAVRKTYTVQDSEMAVQENGTRKLILKAAPAQIAEDYIVTVYDSDGNEKAVINASIEDYCQAIIESNDARLTPYKDIAQSLLNYGALANEYFGYAALSKEVTGEDYAVSHSDDYKAEVDVSEFRSKAKASFTEGVDASGNPISITGVSYVALLDPELRFYVSQENEVLAALTDVSIDNPDLEAKMVKTGNGFCVRVTGLKSSDFAKTFTVKIGTAELTYNGCAYLYTVLTQSNDEKLVNLAKGVYRYASACEAKFS